MGQRNTATCICNIRRHRYVKWTFFVCVISNLWSFRKGFVSTGVMWCVWGQPGCGSCQICIWPLEQNVWDGEGKDNDTSCPYHWGYYFLKHVNDNSLLVLIEKFYTYLNNVLMLSQSVGCSLPGITESQSEHHSMSNASNANLKK